MDQNNTNLQTVLASRDTQILEKQVILSTIQCKKTERLPQAGNDKTKIYENILARRSGMDYSPGIQFQTSLINMEKAKSITMNNQPGKSTEKKNGTGVAP